MKIVVLAIALSAATACVGASTVQSMTVFTELMAKGMDVGKDVDEYMRRGNPEAAVAVMNRHIRDVDATIGKVDRDPAISSRHKVLLLKELRDYKGDLAQSRDQLRALTDLQLGQRLP